MDIYPCTTLQLHHFACVQFELFLLKLRVSINVINDVVFPGQEAELSESKQRRIEEVGELRSKLEDRSKAVEVLSQQIEDQRDENKTLKRRHAANIKVRQRRRYTAV